MIYGTGMLYELLDRYAENDMDEMEHAFIASVKWSDSDVLKISDKKFWVEVEKYYGVFLQKRKGWIL